MIAESLTPELIENNKISQWDGKLPVVSGSGASIIDIGSLNDDVIEAQPVG
jgi:hypothetical protein